jgi:ornithine carbamoyltransferase
MPKRDFLQVPDLTADEIRELFDLALQMKAGKYRKQPLAISNSGAASPSGTPPEYCRATSTGS